MDSLVRFDSDNSSRPEPLSTLDLERNPDGTLGVGLVGSLSVLETRLLTVFRK